MPVTSRKIQEELYQFPYHHLVQFDVDDYGGFCQFRNRRAGFRYAAYLLAVLEEAGKCDFRSLLDIGCGDGYFLKRVAEKFPGRELVGVDLSRRAIEFARLLNEKDEHGTRDIEFYCRDVIAEPLARQFDVVTSIAVLEHIPPEQVSTFVAGNHDLVKPGGRYIVAVPSHNLPLHRIKRHYQHFDPDSLRVLLSPHFDVRRVEYLNNERWWGRLVALLLTNPLFVLNYRPMREWLFKLYVQRCLWSRGRKGYMLLAVCVRPKGPSRRGQPEDATRRRM